MTLSNVLTFGKFSVSRKPIINGGAIRSVGLLFIHVMHGLQYKPPIQHILWKNITILQGFL